MVRVSRVWGLESFASLGLDTLRYGLGLRVEEWGIEHWGLVCREFGFPGRGCRGCRGLGIPTTAALVCMGALARGRFQSGVQCASKS